MISKNMSESANINIIKYNPELNFDLLQTFHVFLYIIIL